MDEAAKKVALRMIPYGLYVLTAHDGGGNMTGCPVLSPAAAAIECRVVGEVRRGDHTVFVGEVVDVRLQAEVAGRPDEKTLVLKDLGENVFYGG